MVNKNTENQTICAPFVPDEENPYIFISYAHADRDRVFPIIKRIYENGWRVWYDEGLELGNDYYGSLKKHICDCAVFLLFASQNAFDSHFITTCEIPQADEFNKKIVVLRLEKDRECDMDELQGAVYTDDAQVESVLDGIKFLYKTQPRKAVGHQININVLKQIRDSRFHYVKCAGGVRITEMESDDTTAYIPDVYPPFSNLNVVEVSDHIFWRKTNLEKVYLPSGIESINLSVFLNNKQLKDIYIPESVEVTNVYGIDLSASPYVIHCAKNSPAYKFAKRFGIKTAVEDKDDSKKRTDVKPYAYISISYGGPGKSISEILDFSTVMELSEHRCNYMLGRMGNPSEKKVLQSIENCACFVAFIDRQYAKTDVINDLRTAINLGKKIAIYQTEECDLPEDLEDLQSIHQLRYNTGSAHERTVKLINWLTENKCRDSYDLDGFEYEATDEGISLTKYIGRYVNPTIEPYFCDLPIISVGGFYKCDFIRSVTIPEGVQKIGYLAFAKCTELRSVSIPSTVKSIGKEAFSGCKKLKTLSLPDNIPVATGVYSGWPNLKTVTIPEKETLIHDSAFSGCEGLKSVVLHDKVTKIGSNAFSGCIKLKDINIPDSVTQIGASAFYGCRELKTIELPPTLERISWKAFVGCEKLEKVVVLGMETKVVMFKEDLRAIPIYCKKGSWIQLQCDKWGIAYTLID